MSFLKGFAGLKRHFFFYELFCSVYSLVTVQKLISLIDEFLFSNKIGQGLLISIFN